MGGKSGGFLNRLFTKEGWKGGNSIFQNFFDPGALVFDLETASSDKPKPPIDTEAIAASAAAREEERRRLASNGRSSIVSGRRTDALSASIGKRSLGGGL